MYTWNTIAFTPFSGSRNNLKIQFSKQEYSLLMVLCKQTGKTVSRATLALALWGGERPYSRAIDMHISSLRKKLAKLLDSSDHHIATIHGEGYLLY